MDAHGALRIGLVLVLTTAVILVMVFALKDQGEPEFLVYWSAARLLVTGGNPYNPLSLRTLEHETRNDRAFNQGQSFASWNPPWLLVLLLPFGLLPFDLAARLWLLCNIGLIGAASVLTWQLLSGPSDRRGLIIVLIASMLFGPSLVTLLLGQISSLVFIGLVLSAWWLRAGRDRLAGAALFLTTIKPHVTYFVLLLLVLWLIRHRRWQAFWGMLAAGLISLAILWMIFPGWIRAYLGLLSIHRWLIPQYITSTVGSLGYALWRTNLFRFAGILLLPFACSLLRLADSQGWLTAMNVALLISVPLALYGFVCDQIVFLPALAQMFFWVWRRELPPRWMWTIGGGLVISYAAFFAALTIPLYLYSHWFACIPLALAGLYALAWKQRTPTPSSAASHHLEKHP